MGLSILLITLLQNVDELSTQQSEYIWTSDVKNIKHLVQGVLSHADKYKDAYSGMSIKIIKHCRYVYNNSSFELLTYVVLLVL